MQLLASYLKTIPLLINQNQIVTVLSIVVIFFLILLILGVRKSYILKKENDKLSELDMLKNNEEKKVYKDFREGHLYDNK